MLVMELKKHRASKPDDTEVVIRPWLCQGSLKSQEYGE